MPPPLPSLSFCTQYRRRPLHPECIQTVGQGHCQCWIYILEWKSTQHGMDANLIAGSFILSSLFFEATSRRMKNPFQWSVQQTESVKINCCRILSSTLLYQPLNVFAPYKILALAQERDPNHPRQKRDSITPYLLETQLVASVLSTVGACAENTHCYRRFRQIKQK